MTALRKRGHECLFVSHTPLTLDNTEHTSLFCRWDAFNFKALDDFAPDTVIVFNGRFTWLMAATEAIKERYNTALCEIAWYTQRTNIYFDKNALAENSVLANSMPCGPWGELEKVWQDKLLPLYGAKKPRGVDLSTPYVVVPLQMEVDTSIVYGSPIFRTMQSLIDWCASTCGDTRLVFKTHPRCPEHQALSFGKHQVINDEATLNDLISHAEAVVGINSTSLMEALVYQKPIVQLGLNVACNSMEVCKTNFRLGLAHAVKNAKIQHDKTAQKQLALMLYSNQVEILLPQKWAVDMIERNDFTPRHATPCKKNR